MSLTLEAPPQLHARPSTAPVEERSVVRPVMRPVVRPVVRGVSIYADLTCPWSYLASRRLALLEADGLEVDWWMVEHDRSRPGSRVDQVERVEHLQRDLDRVSGRLLPGEDLPHSPAGFVPFTQPAVSGYAEAYLAGVAPKVRRLLFEAFWLHGVDLGDARLVRSLLADAVRAGDSRSELVRDWGYAVDVTGAPVSSEAWRLLRTWRTGWSRAGDGVPLLQVGDQWRYGVAAIEWLGSELVRRGIDPGSGVRAPASGAPSPGGADIVDLSWATQHGNRWMRTRREAHSPESFDRLRRWV